MARELHDEIGQALTALGLDAAWLQDRLKASDPAASWQAQSMCGIIDKAIDDIRGIATRLRPGALDNLGLVDALEWYIRDFEKSSSSDASIVPWDARIPTGGDRRYRIAQEALTKWRATPGLDGSTSRWAWKRGPSHGGRGRREGV